MSSGRSQADMELSKALLTTSLIIIKPTTTLYPVIKATYSILIANNRISQTGQARNQQERGKTVKY